jgi:hypothetical protein
MKLPPEGEAPRKTADEVKAVVKAKPPRTGQSRLRVTQYLKAKGIKPGKVGGFIAEAKKLHGAENKATFAEWDARYTAYLCRPVK